MASFVIANIMILLTHVQTQTSCDITGAGSTYSETINGETRRIIANGCPNHDNTCVGKPGTCTVRGESTNITLSIVTPKDINIPSIPCLSNIPNGVDITCIGGQIGVMLNGVSLFSQTAGGNECEDAISAEFTSFNICGGHATGAGQFHYHLAPACLLYQFNDHNDINVNNKHSPQIGWAMDGFPIYGPHGTNGYYIYKCNDSRADLNDCLDECNGHYANDVNGHIIDGFMYHYHVTGPVGDLTGNIKTDILDPAPDKTMFPYTIGCLKGIAAEWKPKLFRNAACATAGTNNEYVPKVMDGVAHIVYPQKVLQTTNPTPTPTSNPISITPSNSSTNMPSRGPTDVPTTNPTESPIITNNPTALPTKNPSNNPTENPTYSPTNNPSRTPTDNPTPQPTAAPIIPESPTKSPTNPTSNPTQTPTKSPSKYPSNYPTNNPAHAPTQTPSENPTETSILTNDPTYMPSSSPLEAVSAAPTKSPSNNPSITPSESYIKTSTLFPTMSTIVSPSYKPYISPTKMPSIDEPNMDVSYSATSSDIDEFDRDNLNSNSVADNALILKYGIIAGSSSVILFCICAVCIFCVYRKMEKKHQNKEESDTDEENVLTPFTPNSHKMQHAVFGTNDEDSENEGLHTATLEMLQQATNIDTFVE